VLEVALGETAAYPYRPCPAQGAAVAFDDVAPDRQADEVFGVTEIAATGARSNLTPGAGRH